MIDYKKLAQLKPFDIVNEDHFEVTDQNDRWSIAFISGLRGEILMYPGSLGEWRYRAKYPWSLYEVQCFSAALEDVSITEQDRARDLFMLTPSEWSCPNENNELSYGRLASQNYDQEACIFLYCKSVLAFGVIDKHKGVIECTLCNVGAEREDLGLDATCSSIQEIIELPYSGDTLKLFLSQGRNFECVTGIFRA